MKLINLHHVGIAVADLDAAIAEYEQKYRIRPIHREIVAAQGVEEAMLAVGGSHIQLLAPLAPDTPVGRFLEKNGEGLHHVAFAVAEIEAALAHLESEGARLIDRVARVGGGGSLIAFVHPKDLRGTLIELVELPRS